MIKIESKRRKPENILKKYPDAILADVTSGAKDGLRKLSPFYPHYGIPVPFSEGVTATCVEAVWQGLKVFESADVDVRMFENDTMKNVKRTVRQFGKPLGHRKGVNGTELFRIHRGAEADIHTDVQMGVGEQGGGHHRAAEGGKQDKDHNTARL